MIQYPIQQEHFSNSTDPSTIESGDTVRLDAEVELHSGFIISNIIERDKITNETLAFEKDDADIVPHKSSFKFHLHKYLMLTLYRQI